ncbi:MAG: restriction endonuclease subunit S [Thermodesulfovibrionales bacterium]
MEVKKGYKQTEVGVIPEDWEVKKLGEFAHVATGNTPPTNDQTNYGHDYFFVSPADLGRGKYIVDTDKKLSKKGFDISRKFPKSSILFTCIGSTIGKSGIAQCELTSNQQINAIFPNDNYSSDYLYYALNLLSPRIKSLAGEQAVPIINKSEFEETFIPLPTTQAEQAAIAIALSDADALISSLEKLIAKKRNIKQGAMQELLMPKEGCMMKKLGEIFTFSGGYSASREQLSNDGFCYLHYGDIHGAKKTFINVKNEYTEIPKLKILLKNVSPKSLLSDGDIVFVDASEDDEGTSRHIVVKNPDGIPYISGLHTIVAKSKDNSLDNDFKRYCFQTKVVKSQFKFYAVGTKVSGISKTNIAKIEIAIPSKAEQTRIATILSDMDAEIEQLEQKLDKYKMIKQGMMQELLNGRTRLI